MSTSLVGYSGFVGSNLVKSFCFDHLYNSKNIQNAFDSETNLLVYSGVRAEKFLANKNPEEDFKIIKNAIENVKKMKAKKVVLISTIDVYKNPNHVDEDAIIETENLHPYGYNRYYLEKWIEENIEDHLIVRLPGLYGENIKKNFIFDLVNVIPSMLNEEKFIQFSNESSLISKFYFKQDNGFYKCNELDSNNKRELKQCFNQLGFSALNFTDSRASFQFYNLEYLWGHIQVALQNDIRKLNLAIQPIIISELYKHIKGSDFKNEIANVIPSYNFKTKYAELFNGENGYIFDKTFIMEDIKKFVNEEGR